MLSKEEAVTFLKDVLGVNVGQTESREDRFKLLNEILHQHHQVPFHTMILLADPADKRHRPDIREVKQAGMTKEGGLCYTLNTFLFYLLNALGYEAYVNMCHVVAECENNHVLVILKNLLTDGDTYLAEVGFGNPTFKVVCLDFDEETPVIHQANLVYKYDKVADKIRRLHKQKDEEKFDVMYEFKLNPTTDITSIFKYFDYIFENVDALKFHGIFLAKKFEKNQVISVINHTLIIVEENGDRNKTELADKEAVIKAVQKYFPEIRESIVQSAYANWKLSEHI